MLSIILFISLNPSFAPEWFSLEIGALTTNWNRFKEFSVWYLVHSIRHNRWRKVYVSGNEGEGTVSDVGRHGI